MASSSDLEVHSCRTIERRKMPELEEKWQRRRRRRRRRRRGSQEEEHFLVQSSSVSSFGLRIIAPPLISFLFLLATATVAGASEEDWFGEVRPRRTFDYTEGKDAGKKRKCLIAATTFPRLWIFM